MCSWAPGTVGLWPACHRVALSGQPAGTEQTYCGQAERMTASLTSVHGTRGFGASRGCCWPGPEGKVSIQLSSCLSVSASTQVMVPWFTGLPPPPHPATWWSWGLYCHSNPWGGEDPAGRVGARALHGPGATDANAQAPAPLLPTATPHPGSPQTHISNSVGPSLLDGSG